MFWKKETEKPASPTPRVTSVAPGDELDRAIDTIGAVLRAFGEYSFDTDRSTAKELKDECSALLQRFLLGRSRQNDPEDTSPRRDWGSLHRFFEAARKIEQAYVVTGLGNLRQAVQEFAQALTAAVSEDRESDAKVDVTLTQLLAAVAGNDTEAVRRTATEVADAVRTAMSRRRERESEQLLRLGKQVKVLRDELDAARTKATLDALTQLFNRASFDEEIDKVAKLGLLLGSEPCLILLDVDHFKLVNDRFGHPAGDAVLKGVADNLVRHFLRKEDFVARYGGEEFAIVVRDSNLEKVTSRTERARAVLEQAQLETPAGPVSVTFSAGVTPLHPGEPVAEWISRADRALYAAKHAGRNRVEVAPAPQGT